ncbi:hypothetical protein MAR_027056 [Mya arenaria]|uniref:Uncharacterized protein n=1 Tax=Mya arenaria TaxID=6604 RepID=A0ABY7EVZ4_MYAAR|nr:hypothetical protein MAR_027056 [Mya arenaria]
MPASDRSQPSGVLGLLRCAGNSIVHYTSQPGANGTSLQEDEYTNIK